MASWFHSAVKRIDKTLGIEEDPSTLFSDPGKQQQQQQKQHEQRLSDAAPPPPPVLAASAEEESTDAQTHDTLSSSRRSSRDSSSRRGSASSARRTRGRRSRPRSKRNSQRQDEGSDWDEFPEFEGEQSSGARTTKVAPAGRIQRRAEPGERKVAHNSNEGFAAVDDDAEERPAPSTAATGDDGVGTEKRNEPCIEDVQHTEESLQNEHKNAQQSANTAADIGSDDEAAAATATSDAMASQHERKEGACEAVEEVNDGSGGTEVQHEGEEKQHERVESSRGRSDDDSHNEPTAETAPTAAKQTQEQAQRTHGDEEDTHEASTDDEGSSDADDVEALRREFSARMGKLEMRLKAVCKERDAYKQSYEKLWQEHTQASGKHEDDMARALVEKDQQIAALLAEGKQLSEKQFKSANINKALQKKNKENEQHLVSLRKKLSASETRVAELEERLAQEQTKQKKYQEDASQVSAVAASQSKELEDAKSKITQLTQHNTTLQAALDKAHQELERLEQAKADAEERAQQAATSASINAQNTLQEQLQEKDKMIQLERRDFEAQISDLRASVSRLQSSQDNAAADYEQRIADLRNKLRLSEERVQELSAEITQTSQPFMKRIQALQDASTKQRSSLEAVIDDLQGQLEDAHMRVEAAEEREREFQMKNMQTQAKHRATEESLAAAKSDVTRLRSQLEALEQKVETLSAQLKSESDKYASLREKYEEANQNWLAERTVLSKQLQDSEAKRQSYHMELEALRRREAAQVGQQQTEREHRFMPADVDESDQDIDWLKLQRDYEDLAIRHDRLLQMYGQKDEELQQLQSDFVDVKKMFQEQINTLVTQLEEQRSAA